jgi:predicted regulator of Ras-like GTPase activity (Roadblock/LC7/MglB family)
MGSEHDVLSALQALRARRSEIEGSIVATTDGMVVAHDLSGTETYGIEPEGVAALAAVNLGLSQRIADTASHGDLQETVIRGAFGLVITYAAGERALLTVLARPTEELTALHNDAREVAAQIATVLTHTWQDDAATWRGVR